MPAAPPVSDNLGPALVQSYAMNDRMNQTVLEHLDPAAWRARPPARRSRTIAAIFAHMHNVRRKWLRLTIPRLPLPAPLDGRRCTPEQARAALAESAARCCEMLSEALAQPAPRIQTFRRDGWAQPWPVGAAMAAYMIVHDAHHRGQVCMLAHQLGFPLPAATAAGMWAWEKLYKERGFTRPR